MYQRQVLSKAPVSGIVLKLSDVGKLAFDDAPEVYWNLVRAQATTQNLTVVSALNNLLLLRPHDPGIHRALEELFLRPEYRADVAAPIQENEIHPVFRLAFSRLGNLLNTKLLICAMSEREARRSIILRALTTLLRKARQLSLRIPRLRARNRKSRQQRLQSTSTRTVPGDLAVLANEFTGSSRIREAGQVTPMDLILEFLPRWEIDNPPDVAYSWTRAAKMFAHLNGADGVVSTLRDAIPLHYPHLSYRGVPVNEFMAAAFGIYSEAKAITPEDLGQCVVDVRSLARSLRMRADVLHRFLRAAAVRLETIARNVGGLGTLAHFRQRILSDAFATDSVELRQHPIVDLDDGTYLIVDAQLVVELVSSQLYWTLFDSLDLRQRKLLRDLWGRLFELYLFDLLGHFYPAASEILRTDVAFSGGQIDALLDFGEGVVVFEFKASLLLREARFSRDPALFEREMRKKFFRGLQQLAGAAGAVLDGRVRTATFPAKPMRIFPVLVADEAALQSLGVNEYVNDIFQPLVGALPQAFAVRPITVMSVQELEGLLPYIEQGFLRWPTILEERFTGNRVALESVHQMVYFHQQHDGVPHLRNEFLLAEFKRIWETIITPLRTTAA